MWDILNILPIVWKYWLLLLICKIYSFKLWNKLFLLIIKLIGVIVGLSLLRHLSAVYDSNLIILKVSWLIVNRSLIGGTSLLICREILLLYSWLLLTLRVTYLLIMLLILLLEYVLLHHVLLNKWVILRYCFVVSLLPKAILLLTVISNRLTVWLALTHRSLVMLGWRLSSKTDPWWLIYKCRLCIRLVARKGVANSRIIGDLALGRILLLFVLQWLVLKLSLRKAQRTCLRWWILLELRRGFHHTFTVMGVLTLVKADILIVLLFCYYLVLNLSFMWLEF